jgi:hypothetical protein
MRVHRHDRICEAALQKIPGEHLATEAGRLLAPINASAEG